MVFMARIIKFVRNRANRYTELLNICICYERSLKFSQKWHLNHSALPTQRTPFGVLFALVRSFFAVAKTDSSFVQRTRFHLAGTLDCKRIHRIVAFTPSSEGPPKKERNMRSFLFGIIH